MKKVLNILSMIAAVCLMAGFFATSAYATEITINATGDVHYQTLSLTIEENENTEEHAAAQG